MPCPLAEPSSPLSFSWRSRASPLPHLVRAAEPSSDRRGHGESHRGDDPGGRGLLHERDEGLRRSGPRHRHRCRRQAGLRQGLRRAQQERWTAGRRAHDLPDRLDHEGVSRNEQRHHGRSRQAQWDDRVVDLYPEFQMKDPWVTREFRVFDLLAQRSGLPALVNDMLAMLGFDEAALIRSLRYVDPISSFRTTFAYTNITHLLAEPHRGKCRRRSGLECGPSEGPARSARHEGLDLHGRSHRRRGQSCQRPPLDARGHGRGALHADLPLSLRLGPATSTPTSRTWRAGSGCSSATAPSKDTGSSRRRISPSPAWRGSRSATGCPTPWVGTIWRRANGSIVWHDGDTLSFGSFVGLLPDRNVGVIILTNESNVEASAIVRNLDPRPDSRQPERRLRCGQSQER